MPQKETYIIINARRDTRKSFEGTTKSISKRIYQPVRSTFFKNFAKTVQSTKNRSIRIVFQYKYTIKPKPQQKLKSDMTCEREVRAITAGFGQHSALWVKLKQEQFIFH